MAPDGGNNVTASCTTAATLPVPADTGHSCPQRQVAQLAFGRGRHRCTLCGQLWQQCCKNITSLAAGPLGGAVEHDLAESQACLVP